jgi:hypothetical protein
VTLGKIAANPETVPLGVQADQQILHDRCPANLADDSDFRFPYDKGQDFIAADDRLSGVICR